MSKKRLGIPASLNQGLSDIVSAVDNYAGKSRFSIVKLQRMETDPDNPRELQVSRDDISRFVSTPHKLNSQNNKDLEIEALLNLANAIQAQDIIQPVVVYKHGEKYRLIAGERRYLASILAGKADIQAKIFDVKPTLLDIRMMQWQENNNRENLSLKDRLKNIKQVIDEFMKANPSEKVTLQRTAGLLSMSITQAKRYLDMINGPKVVLQAINSGKITDSKVVEFILLCKDSRIQDVLITDAIKGVGLAELRKIKVHQVLTMQSNVNKMPAKSRGKQATRVNLGTTKHIPAVRLLIDQVASTPKYHFLNDEMKQVDWQSFKSVQTAFARVMTVLEKSTHE